MNLRILLWTMLLGALLPVLLPAQEVKPALPANAELQYQIPLTGVAAPVDPVFHQPEPATEAEWDEVTHPSIHKHYEEEEDDGLDSIKQLMLQQVLDDTAQYLDNINLPGPQPALSTPNVERNFEGNSYNGFRPPDNALAISDEGWIVSIVNSSISFSDENGNVVLNSQPLADYFSFLNLSSFFYDPRILYDPVDDRFILVCLHGISPTTSRIIVSFSQSQNPSDGWWTFVFEGDFLDQNLWLDYPQIGVSNDDLYVSGNLFTSSFSYSQSVILQFKKSDGFAGNSLSFNYWANVTGGNGQLTGSIKPVAHGFDTGYGPGIYLISSRSTWGNSIQLLDITADSDSNPQLNAYSITCPSYQIGSDAQQQGTSKLLDVGDCRIQMAYYDNGVIHYVHHNEYANGYNGIRYGRLDLADLTIDAEDYGQAGYTYAYPVIAPFSGPGGDVVMGYTHSGNDIYPNLRALTIDADFNTSGAVAVKLGQSPIAPSGDAVERWGDYSGIARRHNAGAPTIWLYGCFGKSNNYGNWIAELTSANAGGGQATCTGGNVLTACSGTFGDGSGSADYANNLNCDWLISPAGAAAVTLTFSSFNTEQDADFVRIYDGVDDSAPLLGEFSGNNLPPAVTGASGSLFITFTSNAIGVGAGWQASYGCSTSGGATCSGTTTLTDCAGSFADGSGSDNYSNNLDCSWLISPDGANSVTLTFDDFLTENGYDFVRIYDGVDDSAPLLGEFSGPSLPDPVTGASGSLFVHFDTDGNTVAPGWSASYTCDNGPACGLPTEISVVETGYAYFWINWLPPQNYDFYRVRYREEGETDWTELVRYFNYHISLNKEPCTTYEWQIKTICTGGIESDWSPTYTVTTDGCDDTDYCYSYGNSSQRWIERVQFGGIDNTSSNDYGYANYTDEMATIEPGGAYPINVSAFSTVQTTVGLRVWIDFNQDGDFEDADETVLTRADVDIDLGESKTVTGSISVPITAVGGTTRMRISLQQGGLPEPCDTGNNRDVEDYGVTVQAGSYLSLDPTNLSFEAQPAGGQQVQVTSNQSWSAVTAADWITVQNATGDGDGAFTVVCSENQSVDTRTALVEVNGSATVTVTQEGQPAGSGPGWGDPLQTNLSGVLLGQARINDEPAAAEDWIAAFDEAGNLAGEGQLIMNSGIAYIVLTIYGDDPTTDDVDEGISGDEAFILALYDESEDQTYEYPVTGAPTLLDGWSNTNGAPMPGYDNPETIYNFTDAVGDVIPLNAGWNLVSTDVLPADTAVATLLAGLLPGNLEFMTGFDNGATFYDPEGPVFLNTLTHIERGFGYWIKVETEDTLRVSGLPLDESYRKPLDDGWNLVAYPPQSPMTPEAYFGDLLDDNMLEYVTGFDLVSTFYDPNGLPFLNTLTELRNSLGYWIKVGTPNNAPEPAAAGGPEDRKATHLYNFLMAEVDLGPEAAGRLVEIRDEHDRLLATTEVLREGYLRPVAVYGDDPLTTAVEGAQPGATLRFLLDGEEAQTKASFLGDRSPLRLQLHFAETEAEPLHVFPNPFRNSLNLQFELEKAGTARIEIRDARGGLLAVPVSGRYEAGSHRAVWPAEHLPEGIYETSFYVDGRLMRTKRVVHRR